MKVEQAISLTRAGFAIVPVHYPVSGGCSCRRHSCSSIGKHPFPSKWQESYSNKPDEIRAWWKAFKDPNAGVVTGKPSGVVVLDIDVKTGGYDSLEDLQVKNGKLPETATVETGSGGRHFYFKAPNHPVKNATGIVPGIDFRGDGGFVVSPGSIGLKGAYDWYDEQTPETVGFATIPEWLFSLVYKPPQKSPEMALNGPMTACEGGRNVWLSSVAGAMRNKGLGYKPIFAALYYANLENCKPPLEKEEVELIAKSISRYEITGGNPIL